MRHPHHLPPNVPAAARAPSADAMGVLIPAEPLQRPCGPSGACKGADCGGGCAHEGRATNTRARRTMSRDQFWYAISIAALAGISVGIVLGALRWAAEWVSS